MTADRAMTACTARTRRSGCSTCDVDGVLTDGRIYVDDDGRETEGVQRARRRRHQDARCSAGITVAWITGSSAPAVMHRARTLGVARVVQGAEDKLDAVGSAARRARGCRPRACAHIGDDLPDVPLFARCGLARRASRTRRRSVRARAHYVTARDGGLRRRARALRADSRRAGRARSPQLAAFGA